MYYLINDSTGVVLGCHPSALLVEEQLAAVERRANDPHKYVIAKAVIASTVQRRRVTAD